MHRRVRKGKRAARGETGRRVINRVCSRWGGGGNGSVVVVTMAARNGAHAPVAGGGCVSSINEPRTLRSGLPEKRAAMALGVERSP